VEQVLLKWINGEVMERLGLPRVADLDLSWKDGVAFCALVHHFCPPLIDMNMVVNRSSPRENLHLAFETARLHLNIRPLLEVEDFLLEGRSSRPDKRSIITYISQFLRIIPTLVFTEGQAGQVQDGRFVTTLTTTTTVETRERLVRLVEQLDVYKPIIEWLERIVQDPRVGGPPPASSDTTSEEVASNMKWYMSTRKEFLEKRIQFKEIIEQLPSVGTDPAGIELQRISTK